MCPTLVPSRPNSPRSAASAQLKTRFGRGTPSSPHKIWLSEWKTLAISGKIRGQEGLKSQSVGGFHLSQPAIAIEILERTRDIVPDHIPVTVKMRRGIDDSAEARNHFFTILDGAIDAGLAAVTVHERTVVQRYVGPSRWTFLSAVKRHVGTAIKVLGSGDLFEAEDCLRMIQQSGIDGVTVARGAIGNPWIFEQARALADGQPLPPPPSLREQAEVMREHFALCEATFTPERAPLLMRKFCIKYSQSHPDHENVPVAFVKIRTRGDFESALALHYQ